MRQGTRKPLGLKARIYATCLNDLSENLAVFPWSNISEFFCDRSKCIFLNRTPNRWSNHAYVQGFYCESITFKAAVNMFECIEISESIYEVVVETSYKKILGQIPTVMLKAGK